MLKNIISKAKKRLLLRFISPIILFVLILTSLIGYFISEQMIRDIVAEADIEIADKSANILGSLEIVDELMTQRLKAGMNILRNESFNLGNPSKDLQVNVNGKFVNDLKFGNKKQALKYSLVDKVARLINGTVTVFSKSDNDFVRISTNVIKNGERAIGSILDPQGSAIKKLSQGNSFYGVVDLLGTPFITAYEPIQNAENEIIGAWYVGYPLKTIDIIGQTIEETEISNKGFVALRNYDDKINYHSSSYNSEEIERFLNEEKTNWTTREDNFDQWGYQVLTAYNRNSVIARGNEMRLVILLFSGVFALIISFIIYIVLNKYVLRRLKNLTVIADEVAQGNSRIEVSADTDDEIGLLEKSFKKMIKNIQEETALAENIAEGNLNLEVKVRSEKDDLSRSYKKMIQNLKSLTEKLNTQINEIVEGNLKARINPGEFNGSYKDLAAGVNKIVEESARPIREGVSVLEEMSQGDLTVRMKGDYRGDHKIIERSINKLGESLHGLVIKVSETVAATVSSAVEISSSSEQMAAGAQEQSSQTAEVAGAVEEMTKTILETSQNSVNAANFSKESGEKANNGSNQVNKAIAGMENVAKSAEKTARIIKSLTGKTEGIGQIANVINEIADQTNLLALNAAIEAARAGEHGRGFAVVADEVRKLAERTTKATKEIADTIKDIQDEAKQADDSMAEAGNSVSEGIATNKELREVFNVIVESADKVRSEIEQVATASEEQSSAAEQISQSIEGISGVTSQSAAGIQQIAKTAEDLNHLTENLRKLISAFKIVETDENQTVKPFVLN